MDYKAEYRKYKISKVLGEEFKNEDFLKVYDVIKFNILDVCCYRNPSPVISDVFKNKNFETYLIRKDDIDPLVYINQHIFSKLDDLCISNLYLDDIIVAHFGKNSYLRYDYYNVYLSVNDAKNIGKLKHI